MSDQVLGTVTPLDWGVIICYLAVVIGIALVSRKFAVRNLESYFLGGRKMPGWANGFSYAAAALNSDVAPAYIGWTVGTGLFICWFYIGRFGLAFLIGGVLFALFWRRLNLFTSPEFYELRFPGRAGSILRGWIACRSAFIAVVAWSGTGLLGLAKVTGPVIGWDKFQTIAIVVTFVLIYVYLAGYVGVVATDVMHSTVMILASIVLCIFVLVGFGGPAGLYDGVVSTVGAEFLRSTPPISHPELSLMTVIILFIGTGIGYGGDVAPMGGAMEGQRILSSRNGREAVKMYIWTTIILFILLLVLTLPGLAAVALWPDLPTADRAVREEAFGRLLQTYMAPGFLGLALAGLIAAVMSTLSANFNFGSQIVTNDLYRRFIRPDASERHYMIFGRMMLFLICGLAVLVAIKGESIITIAIFMIGLTAAEFTANWAQWWWWRFNSQGRLAASFGGPAIFVFLRLGLTPWLASRGGPVLTEWHAILIAIGLTAILWLTVTLLTPPQDRQVLKDFYLRARPLGFWGPVRRDLGIEDTKLDKSLILSGFGISILGVVWISLGTLFLSNLFVGLYGKAVGLGIPALIVALIFLKLFQWFMSTLISRFDTPIGAAGD